MSELVGNHEDRFSRVEAQIIFFHCLYCSVHVCNKFNIIQDLLICVIRTACNARLIVKCSILIMIKTIKGNDTYLSSEQFGHDKSINKFLHQNIAFKLCICRIGR